MTGARAAPLLPPLLSGEPQALGEVWQSAHRDDAKMGKLDAMAAVAFAAERRCQERVAALDVGAIVAAAPRRGLRDAGEAVRAAVLRALGAGDGGGPGVR